MIALARQMNNFSEALTKATDEDVIIGIKKVLALRGYSRKELNELQHLPFQ